jgi:hypothetical protein
VSGLSEALERLRVVHCPVNTAGIPWQYVLALRRKGVDARLVVFEHGRLHPEADVSLDHPTGLARRLFVQSRAQLGLLPTADYDLPRLAYLFSR